MQLFELQLQIQPTSNSNTFLHKVLLITVHISSLKLPRLTKITIGRELNIKSFRPFVESRHTKTKILKLKFNRRKFHELLFVHETRSFSFSSSTIAPKADRCTEPDGPTRSKAIQSLSAVKRASI